jgi:diaminopimelate decarboxylase
MLKLAGACDFIPREISPGGGWGVPYTDFDPEDDPAPWVETIAKTLVEECALRKWPLPKLILEPGRWLAARAGLAVYTVGAVKTAMDGTRMAAVDGGLGDNPRPELYRSAYTAYLLPKTEGESRRDLDKLEDWAIVGRYCENGDQLIRSAHIPQPRRGDRIVIPVSGAYHLSMASNYNLVPRPAVLWVGKNGVEVLQKREEIETSAWWLGK